MYIIAICNVALECK